MDQAVMHPNSPGTANASPPEIPPVDHISPDLSADHAAILSRVCAWSAEALFSTSDARPDTACADVDPWRDLDAAAVARLVLRFCTHHTFSERAAKTHLAEVARWRRDTQPWKRGLGSLPRHVKHGLPAAVVSQCTGRGGECLVFVAGRLFMRDPRSTVPTMTTPSLHCLSTACTREAGRARARSSSSSTTAGSACATST